MKLVPQSLFGRLVLILLGGLLLAQGASFYLNATERGQLLYRAGGMQLAQRIADIAKLLDSMSAAERPRIAALFNGPPLVVSLGAAPLARAGAADESDWQLGMFTGVMRYALGDGLEVSVARRQGAPPSFAPRGERGPGRGPMMHPGGGPGFGPGPGAGFFTVQVALRDGTRVNFDSYLTQQESATPLRLGLTLALLIGTVVVVSLIAVRWATAPLAQLASAAEALGADLNRPPLAETGPTEARRAARAFNRMQQQLATFINDRTRVFTAMSHDLKTPITRLRLRAELLEDPALQAKFAADLHAMESMVGETLDFMRDRAAEEPVQPVDVTALLESMQSDYQDMGADVSVAGAAGASYPGRPLALRRCLTNLVDNALRYGKRAAIEVRDSPAALTIFVRDDGPGMPGADLERAFEPFYRGEASRSRETGGTGLGLGIARNIARAHRGELALRNRPEGGLEAALTLPR